MTIDETTLDVLKQVAGERAQQQAEWGAQEHAPSIYLTILMEEVGEAAKALLEGKPKEYRAELLQVAAVAVAAIECADSAAANPSNDEAWGVVQLQKEMHRLREKLARQIAYEEELSADAAKGCQTICQTRDEVGPLLTDEEGDESRKVVCPKCDGVLEVLDRTLPNRGQCDRCQGTGYILREEGDGG